MTFIIIFTTYKVWKTNLVMQTFFTEIAALRFKPHGTLSALSSPLCFLLDASHAVFKGKTRHAWEFSWDLRRRRDSACFADRLNHPRTPGVALVSSWMVLTFTSQCHFPPPSPAHFSSIMVSAPIEKATCVAKQMLIKYPLVLLSSWSISIHVSGWPADHKPRVWLTSWSFATCLADQLILSHVFGWQADPLPRVWLTSWSFATCLADPLILCHVSGRPADPEPRVWLTSWSFATCLAD